MPPRTPSERACLVRLQEMETALQEMERELPDEARALGAEARRKVTDWVHRLVAGGADLDQLGRAMQDLSALVDALAERVLDPAGDPSAGRHRN